jgi:hypothetical protein
MLCELDYCSAMIEAMQYFWTKDAPKYSTQNSAILSKFRNTGKGTWKSHLTATAQASR